MESHMTSNKTNCETAGPEKNDGGLKNSPITTNIIGMTSVIKEQQIAQLIRQTLVVNATKTERGFKTPTSQRLVSEETVKRYKNHFAKLIPFLPSIDIEQLYDVENITSIVENNPEKCKEPKHIHAI